MNWIWISLFFFLPVNSCITNSEVAQVIDNTTDSFEDNESILHPVHVTVGAERYDEYVPDLFGKRVGLVVNQTSMVKFDHLVDVLVEKGVDIKTVFAPEHGFRGTADAGEKVSNGVDSKTGIPIISLYGKNRKPSASQLANLDVVLFDIQDVGARFYTYISTLEYVMEACAEQGKQFIVLDRPNPNGYFVDGPILDLEFQSFIGRQQIPVVHGMTVGEYAQFLNGEDLLKNSIKADLKVVTCLNYNHNTEYELPIAPSPNLPNQQSILLYPSLCLFEGTNVSVGRGTNTQFQVIGSPKYTIGSYTFRPEPKPGAKNPKFNGENCAGYNLTQIPQQTIYDKGQLNMSWLINMYQFHANNGHSFFLKNNFFDKLAGTDLLRHQLEAGLSEEEIRLSWQDGLNEFKQVRKKYLLYQDFE